MHVLHERPQLHRRLALPRIWSEKKILITVKTYPEYSSRYTETVCTAGVLADTKELIRIYPVRYRYLDGDSQFAKYQWIRAKIKKSTSDNRPESYKIRDESIVLGEIIGSTGGGWEERANYLLSESNIYNSIEALTRARVESNVSLGVVKPKEIVGFRIEMKSRAEIEEASGKKKGLMAQLGMFEDKKDLDLMPLRFILNFSCDDPGCGGHNLSILDWEIAELYRKVEGHANWQDKIKNKVLNQIFSERRETYLILGNMASHQHIFCILGIFWPPKVSQLKLF